MIAEPRRFSSGTAALLDDPANQLLLSLAGGWQIAIKVSLGRLSFPSSPAKYVSAPIEKTGVTSLRIEDSHAVHVATLKAHHRYPFDRLIIAQAELEDATMLTADRQSAPYSIAIHWA